MNVMVRLHNSEALKETLTYGIRILFLQSNRGLQSLRGPCKSDWEMTWQITFIEDPYVSVMTRIQLAINTY